MFGDFGFNGSFGRFGTSSGSASAPASSAITLPADVWAFGASSMAGAQLATDSGTATGTDDSLTNTVRAIEGLGAGSLAYTTVGGSQVTRPIEYNLTGANASRKIRNRGVGGRTSGPTGTIFTDIDAARVSPGFGASDFMILHQGDNGVNPGTASRTEFLADGYAALRGAAPTQVTAGNFIQITNTQGGQGPTGILAGEPPGGARALLNAASLRVQSDLNPGRVFSFYETLIDRATGLDANDLIDRARGVSPRSCMMNDASHQIAKGYAIQADNVLTPVIDAWAGGTPFPLKQVIEAVTPATPAAGDAIGSIVAYGSGGTFSLDTSNTQSDYAVSSSGAITRIGATPPTRDITWAAVKTSKSGRFDKVQPLIGICERAASGVSRMVEFDGFSILGMPDSKLANSAKASVLFRLKSTDQSVAQAVFGAVGGTTQCAIRILTGGTLEFSWRNAGGTVIFNQTTAANFRTVDPVRWVGVCMDFTGAAVAINKITTWIDPAGTSPTLTQDALGADAVRLNAALAIGAFTAAGSSSTTYGKFCIGDFAIFNDYIDWSVLARRQEVANSDGTPKAAWVSGGGVTNGITPLMYMGGNAGDWRQCRLRGSSIPASPGASGQYMAFNCRERSAGVPGFLVTV